MSPKRSTRMLAKQADARLVELCLQGNESAFEAVVLRYRRELLGYCRQLGLSDSRAEDALQQALLKAWLALESGTDVRELRPWLRRIVHNTALNLVRNAQDNRTVDLDSPLVDDADVTDGAVERTTALREALSRVAALPAMQRDAMLLSAIEGRSHEEVASALGISHIAVRGLLYRARSALRAGAAALTPAPLLGWLAQTGGRMAATAGVSSEWAGGGFGFSKAFLEAAAVLAGAAVAVGTVLGPLHPNRHHDTRAPAPVASTHRPSDLPARRAVALTAQGPGRSTASTGGAASHGGLPRTSATGRRLGSWGSPSEGSAPIAAPPGQAPQGRPVAAPTALDAAAGAGPVGSSSGAGGEAPESPKPPTSSGPAEKERKPDDGGSAAESAEHKAEAARELREREAEAARELQEREAEAARELREREAEAARERHEREAGS